MAIIGYCANMYFTTADDADEAYSNPFYYKRNMKYLSVMPQILTFMQIVSYSPQCH